MISQDTVPTFSCPRLGTAKSTTTSSQSNLPITSPPQMQPYVAASDRAGRPAVVDSAGDASSYGAAKVDMIAPGQVSLSTVPRMGMATNTFKAPQWRAHMWLAAAAPAPRQVSAGLSNMQLKQLLMGTVAPVGASRGSMVRPGIRYVNAALPAADPRHHLPQRPRPRQHPLLLAPAPS